jgi:hypothetical protein
MIVEEWGPPKLDEWNPYSPFAVRNSGPRTWGTLVAHSETEVEIGGVVFRPDHVLYTGTLVERDGTEITILHLHRGHRDNYSHGA